MAAVPRQHGRLLEQRQSRLNRRTTGGRVDQEANGVDRLRRSPPTRSARKRLARAHFDRAMAAPANAVSIQGVRLHIGEDWEISDGTFFHIRRFLIQPNTGQTLVEGDLLQLASHSTCMLPKLRNELCQMVVEGPDGQRLWSTAQPATFIRKRHIMFTNMPYPAYCNRTLQHSPEPVEVEALKAATHLVCRWKMTRQLDLPSRRELSCSIEAWREEDVAPSVRVADARKRRDWICGLASASYLSSKKRAYDGGGGGSQQHLPDSHADGNVPCGTPLCTAAAEHSQRYRFGDIFAGAGGASCGARLAGLGSKYHVEKWKVACDSLRSNGFTGVLNVEVADFVSMASAAPACFHVDVLHLSPPCAPYSSLHTRPGKDDEANVAANLCVDEVLHAVRPRIVTLEQTTGLAWRDGGIHFRTLIAAFTWCGFSIRWCTVNLADHSNPQPRRRLIIIAAAPGEALPPHPEPTHGQGLRPLVTVRDVLDRAARERHPNPDMERSNRRNAAPYCAARPLRHCITTDGGLSNLHPDGDRTFTPQQLAMLQGFPGSYYFSGHVTSKRRQIGNAFPPCYAERLFRSVIETLERTDGVNMAGEAAAHHMTRDILRS